MHINALVLIATTATFTTAAPIAGNEQIRDTPQASGLNTQQIEQALQNAVQYSNALTPRPYGIVRARQAITPGIIGQEPDQEQRQRFLDAIHASNHKRTTSDNSQLSPELWELLQRPALLMDGATRRSQDEIAARDAAPADTVEALEAYLKFMSHISAPPHVGRSEE